MKIQLDRTDKEPLYRQIVKQFESLIVNGELPPGSLLPTERELAKRLGVNRSTVSVAYDELRSRGLIHSVQGSGTRVSEDIWGASLRTPNWRSYTETSFFRPTLPMVRRIWDAGKDPRNINLARAEISPDLWPTAVLKQLLSDVSPMMSLGYGDPRGEQCLRFAVSEHVRQHFGLHATPEQILITAGAQQAIHLIIQSLLQPGDAVALEKPSYAYSLPVLASAGLRLFPIRMDENGLVPDDVLTLHEKHRIRMVLVNPTHQNPTGTTLNLGRRRKLLEICGDLGVPIVEDDAYGALNLETEFVAPRPVASMEGGEHQVLYIGTLSKTIAPGLRIGWITGPKSVIDRVAEVKEQIDFGASVISQVVAAKLLTSGVWEKQVEKLLVTLRQRRDTMVRCLREHVGDKLEFSIPRGGYHLWARLKKPVPETTLLDAVIRHGVLVVPGRVYGSDHGYIRLTFANSTAEQIQAGIRRLGDALEDVLE